MTSKPIDTPSKGDPMRASWGAAVAARANECADAIDELRGAVSIASLREPRDRSASFLYPFKVRFVPSDSENAEPGEGDYIIYIPEGSLNVDGHSASGEDFGLEARDGENGWFTLPEPSMDAEWWASFEYAPSDEDYQLRCMIETSPSEEGDDGTIVRSIHVADIHREEGERPKVTQISRGPFTYEFFVESVNGLKGDIEIEPDTESPVSIDDKQIYVDVRTDDETGRILIGLTTEKPDVDDSDAPSDGCGHPGGGLGVDAPHGTDGTASDVDRAGVKAEGDGGMSGRACPECD